MGTVIGSKPSAAMTTITFVTAEFSHSIIRDKATRNGHAATRSQDAAAETVDRIAC